MKRIMFYLLICSIGIVPFVFISQWASYVGVPGFGFSDVYRTPMVLIILREALPILFVSLVILTHRSFFRHRCVIAIASFIFLVICSFVLVLMKSSALKLILISAIAGIRFSMFFLLPYAIFVHFKELDLCSREKKAIFLLNAIIAILLLNFIVSLFPSRLNGVYNVNLFGIRALGITNGPNSAGALMGLITLLLLFYRETKFRLEWIIAFISFFGALLTGSRTGVIGTNILLIACLCAIPMKSKSQKILLTVLIILLPYVIFNINNITRVKWCDWGKLAPVVCTAVPKASTNLTTTSTVSLTTKSTAGKSAGFADKLLQLYRKDKIDEGAIRLRISFLKRFVDVMNVRQLLFGYGLGYGTNLATREKVYIDASRPDASITDSLITLMLVNFGILGSICCVIIVMYFVTNLISFWPGMIFIFYYFLFGFTQNLVESYPTCLMFGILLGCYAVYQHL